MLLHSLFTDNMVLQQQVSCPVWGWGEAGERVVVEFAGRQASATCGADGSWRVVLPPLAASCQGRRLTATGSVGGQRVVENVLVGDVWVCSGQSNMQWSVGQSVDAKREVAAADWPHIRLFDVPRQALAERQDRVAAKWQVCTPATIPSFSAVAYFFGRELWREVGLPIGLVHSSWGGTIAEAWTSREGLLGKAGLGEMVADYERELQADDHEQRLAEHARLVADWQAKNIPTDPGNLGLGRGWARSGFDDGGWPTIELPMLWRNRADLDFNGSLWFRRQVSVPAAWAGRELVLSLGPIDKSDTTWANGVEVGGLKFAEDANSWCTARLYRLPAGLVEAGRLTLAVRVFSEMYQAGFGGVSEQMWLAPKGAAAGERLSLAGTWKFQVEHNLGVTLPPPGPPALRGPGNPNSPYILFDSMLWPLIPYALRGAIWYQGESNAGNAPAYRTLFPAMIRDWREHWQLGDFPFYFVQLANWHAGSDTATRSPWAELREAQTMALELPNTGMAVAIDIGEASDIHPKNKQEVGRRLALNALAKIHGKSVEYSGPMFRQMQVDGDVAHLSFDHAAGLKTVDGGLPVGFELAGSDGVFRPAQATLAGQQVVLRAAGVEVPAAVRYAWAANPKPGVNLVNAAGLPACPFRWPVPA